MKAIICDVCGAVPLKEQGHHDHMTLDPHFYTLTIDCTRFDGITEKVVQDKHLCHYCYTDIKNILEDVNR